MVSRETKWRELRTWSVGVIMTLFSSLFALSSGCFTSSDASTRQSDQCKCISIYTGGGAECNGLAYRDFVK